MSSSLATTNFVQQQTSSSSSSYSNNNNNNNYNNNNNNVDDEQWMPLTPFFKFATAPGQPHECRSNILNTYHNYDNNDNDNNQDARAVKMLSCNLQIHRCVLKFMDGQSIIERSHPTLGFVKFQKFCHEEHNGVCVWVDRPGTDEDVEDQVELESPDDVCGASWDGTDCHACRESITCQNDQGRAVPGYTVTCPKGRKNEVVNIDLCFPSKVEPPVWIVQVSQDNALAGSTSSLLGHVMWSGLALVLLVTAGLWVWKRRDSLSISYMAHWRNPFASASSSSSASSASTSWAPYAPATSYRPPEQVSHSNFEQPLFSQPPQPQQQQQQQQPYHQEETVEYQMTSFPEEHLPSQQYPPNNVNTQSYL